MLRKRFILALLLFAGLLIVATPYWLLATESGLHYVSDKVFSMTQLPITYRNLRGSILTQIEVDSLQYKSASVTVDVDHLKTGFDIFPLTVSIIKFHDVTATQIDVRLHTRPAESSDAPRDSKSHSSGLPVTIAIESAAIEKINVSSSDAQPLNFSSVNFSRADVRQGVSFSDWEFTSSLGYVKTSGYLAFDKIMKNSLEVTWETKVVDRIPVIKGHSQINGSYGNLKTLTDIAVPASLHVDATLEQLFTEPTWQARITGDQFPLSIVVPSSGVAVNNMDILSHGNPDQYTVSGTTGITDNNYGEWRAEFKSEIQGQQLQIQQLLVKSLQSAASITLSGKVQKNAEDFRDYPVDLAMSWSELQWPPKGDQTASSSHGELTVNGNINNYRLKINDASLLVAGQQLSSVSGTGQGTLDALALTEVNAKYLNGSWLGNLDIEWSKILRGKASLKVSNIDPAINWPQWPGKLSATLTIQGGYQQSQWNLSGSIKKLTGQLLDYRISRADTEFALDENNYKFNDIHFLADKNNIAGSFYLSRPQADMPFSATSHWKMDVHNVSQLFPDAKGSIHSQGSLSGSLTSPDIEMTLSGENLQYESYKATSLKANILANMSGDGKLDVDASMTDAILNLEDFSNVSLKAKGTTLKHSLLLDARRKKGQTINVTASGGYQQQAWSGRLTSATINFLKYGIWDLQQPADLFLSKDRTNLSTICLIEKIYHSVVCSELAMTALSSWTGKTVIENFSITNFNAWAPPYISAVDGNINGKFDYAVHDGKIESLNGKLASGSGQIMYNLPTEEKRTQQYREFFVSVVHSSEGVAFDSRINLQEAGAINFHLDLAGLHQFKMLDKDQKLSGDLVIDLKNLVILPILFPELQYVDGKKYTHFTLGGTINDPIIVGTSHLEARTVALPTIGIDLKDVDLKATSNEQRSLRISGQAKSGKGAVTISGELQDYRATQWAGKLSIKGENFTAAQVPEISVDVSPDLLFLLDGDKLNMEGVLQVPRADIKILDSSSSISPSSDLVMIDETGVEKKVSVLQLTASIRIKLGERVTIEGFGAKGKLQGEILVQEKPDGLTTATGELRIIDGKYNAYGTELNIVKGHIIYASVPITSPAVDIEAVRKIDEKTWAGIAVTGKADNPQIRLVSEPAMDDSDILSYIILGRPISQASRQDGSVLTSAAASLGLVGGEALVKDLASMFGIDQVTIESDQTTQQTSMVLGKYLSPRLYAKYAIGLGQAVNTLQLEYKLTNRWILRTETGGQTEGADFLYRIETD